MTSNVGKIDRTIRVIVGTTAVASTQTLTDIEGYLTDEESAKKLCRMSVVYQNYLFSLSQLHFEALTDLVNDIKFKCLDTHIMDWLKNLEQKGTLLLYRGEIEIL